MTDIKPPSAELFKLVDQFLREHHYWPEHWEERDEVANLLVAFAERRVADYEEVLADHRRLVREIDVALNGEAAARQASLCDIYDQIVMFGTRATEAHGEWAEVIEMVQSALSEATGKSAGGFAPMCWNDAIRLLAKDRDERTAAARLVAIEECREVCNERSAWAEEKIDCDDILFATYSNACDDCAEMIGALADKPAADKGES